MPNTLTSRLAELGIEPQELAEIVRQPVATVEEWIANGPSPEGAILLRFLDNDEDAIRRASQLRSTYRTNLQGEGVEHADLSGVPYGTGDTGKVTGGRPA